MKAARFCTALVALAGLLLACGLSCSKKQPAPAKPSGMTEEKPAAAMPKDIVDTAVAAGSFNTLATALRTAGLVGTLKGEGPFTVFAPPDEAFAKLPPGTLDDLLKPENKGKLTAILTYHVVPGKVMAKAVSTMSSAKTVNGQELKIAVEHGTVRVDGAAVTKADIDCSNGVIHVIDAVLLPKEPQPAEAPMDIVDTAVAAGSFKTLVTAVKEAGLVETLKSPGPFTVFAPTDGAFAKLPEGALENLLKDKEQLKAVLLYHVVPGKAMAADVVKMTSAKTAGGAVVPIKVENGQVHVGPARVVKADVAAKNGVIHVIDTVLIPPTE